jgi:hypothetical protein
MALMGAAALLSGCVLGQNATRPATPPVAAASKVLVMEPDVRLWVLDPLGGRQPHAAWTAAAHQHVRVALADALRARGVEPVPYQMPGDSDRARAHDQLVRRHWVVFQESALANRNRSKLLIRPGSLDLTLGADSRSLGEEYEADYALFVRMSDSYQSAGVLGSALLITLTMGALAPPPGQQIGNASLVDLRTGDLVWTRIFTRQGGGDLRQPVPARAAVDTLLKDLPR